MPGFEKSCPGPGNAQKKPRKKLPARFALGHGRSPCPSHYGRPNLEGLGVKACTATEPSDRATCQWVSGSCGLKPQGWGGWGFTRKFDSTFYDLNSGGGFGWSRNVTRSDFLGSVATRLVLQEALSRG